MKFLKWLLILLISVFAIAETYIFASGNTYLNTLFPLTIFSGKMGPDIDELTLFNSNQVSTESPQPWATSDQQAVLNDSILQLMELYEYSTTEAHDALVIDGTSSKIVFKKNFNKILQLNAEGVTVSNN
jgi:hypothetical protein